MITMTTSLPPFFPFPKAKHFSISLSLLASAPTHICNGQVPHDLIPHDLLTCMNRKILLVNWDVGNESGAFVPLGEGDVFVQFLPTGTIFEGSKTNDRAVMEELKFRHLRHRAL